MHPSLRTSIVLIACALGLIVGSALAAGSLAGHRATHPAHPRSVATHRAGVTATQRSTPAADEPLPFRLDAKAVGGVGACLAVHVLWAWWQTRNRCGTCGYSPAFCRCDELARPPSER